MDASQLQRLREQQDMALAETDAQIQQWSKFKSDYVALQGRLKTLPNRITHDVMVPFSSLAFMPGKLVHTNEILVLLGENYFVERSASQAVDIVSRRLKDLSKNLDSLQKQRELLVPRAQFTSDMINMTDVGGDQQEIVEPLDEEQEKQWRKRHSAYLRKAARKRQKDKERSSKEGRPEEEAVAVEDDMWERLDQLERQEAERNELEGLNEDGDDTSDSKQAWEQRSRVSDDRLDADDSDISSRESEEDDDDDDDASDEEEEELDEDDEGSEEDCRTSQRVITFSHTKRTDNLHPQQQTERDKEVREGEEEATIQSPADVYRLMKLTPLSILKTPSALKKSREGQGRRKSPKEGQRKGVSFGRNTVSGGGGEVGGRGSSRDSTEARRGEDRPSPIPAKAFADSVVERPTPNLSLSQPQTRSNDSQPSIDTSNAGPGVHDSSSSGRPMSKFRAAQQQQRQKHSDGVVSPAGDAASPEGEKPSIGPPAPAVELSSSAPSGQAQASARPMSKFRASRQK